MADPHVLASLKRQPTEIASGCAIGIGRLGLVCRLAQPISNVKTVFKAVENASIVSTQNGKPRKTTMLEAVVVSTFKPALNGSQPACEFIINASGSWDEPETQPPDDLDQDDDGLLNAILDERLAARAAAARRRPGPACCRLRRRRLLSLSGSIRFFRWTTASTRFRRQASQKDVQGFPIGYFHIDIAEVQTAEGKLYLYIAIDRTSNTELR